MIKFFRNIRQNLLNQGKTTNYLKYAIGEIVLVVVGILIALQVNNWNEQRKNEKRADSYQKRLKEDIKEELKGLEDRIEYYSVVRNHGESVIEALTTHPDSLDMRFLIDLYQTTQIWEFRVVNDTYQELISSGNIELISDPDLRKHITQYYNETEALLRYWRVETDYRDLVRRYLPIDIQQKIQNACENMTSLNTEHQSTKLIVNCQPNLSTSDVKRGISFFLNSGSLKSDQLLLSANRCVSDLYTKVAQFKRKHKSAEALLSTIESYQ